MTVAKYRTKTAYQCAGLYAYGRLAMRTEGRMYIWNEPALGGYCVVKTASEFFKTARMYRDIPSDNRRLCR
jgi:hypothetical protein